MIALPASIDSIAQLVLKPKESKAHVSILENVQYRDAFDIGSIGQALIKSIYVISVYILNQKNTVL